MSFIIIPSFTFAQEDLSLIKAIKIGLNNNFGIKIQRLEEKNASNKTANAYKDRLPTASLLLRAPVNINSSNSPTSFVQGFYNDRGVSGGLDLNWTLFEGFKAKIEKSRFEKLETQEKSNTMMLAENTINAIILAYYNVLIQKESVLVQEAAQKRSEERFQNAKFQEQHGKISNYEVIRYENSMLGDKANSIQEQKKLELSMQALNIAMGNKYLKEYDLTDQFSYEEQPYDYDKLQQKMAALNTELSLQYLNLSLRKSTIGIIDATKYPKIGINSGITQRLNQTKFKEIDRISSTNFNYYLNFSISYNLFNGDKVNRRLEEEKLREKMEILNVDKVKQKLSNQLKNAITNYHTQLDIIKINEQLIKNLEKNIELEKDRYLNGFSSLLDYQSLQQEYIKAQKNKLDAIYELLVNETEILKLTGGLIKYNE